MFQPTPAHTPMRQTQSYPSPPSPPLGWDGNGNGSDQVIAVRSREGEDEGRNGRNGMNGRGGTGGFGGYA